MEGSGLFNYFKTRYYRDSYREPMPRTVPIESVDEVVAAAGPSTSTAQQQEKVPDSAEPTAQPAKPRRAKKRASTSTDNEPLRKSTRSRKPKQPSD